MEGMGHKRGKGDSRLAVLNTEVFNLNWCVYLLKLILGLQFGVLRG